MVKELRNVPLENAFVVFNGPRLNNLYELEAALRNMNEASFNHHVGSGKNDFSSWVRDVVGDSELAVKLFSANKRSKMASLVKSRIDELETINTTSHTKALLRYGILDFLIGAIIGVVAGIILASLLSV
ncbi:hypothetical protein KY308_02885 [Candidatus Woesearchaeota archaeon]|nr:hypothetical protein [Candidatus Woesearchaeota archaeon]